MKGVSSVTCDKRIDLPLHVADRAHRRLLPPPSASVFVLLYE
jgi:hypothetical protein